MEVEKVLHMVGGAGETSYANNSLVQKRAILVALTTIKESVLDLYGANDPESLGIADLGCSSGPNTLLVVSEVIQAIIERCRDLGRPSPEFWVFLNDLPGNDFNTIFRSFPAFYEEIKEKEKESECYIAGVPGSFYGRLFPTKSLHFVHSSYSLHWLSQLPRGLLEKGSKGNIYLSSTTPPQVCKAYLEQFERDFSSFMRFRFQELTEGGRIVLTVRGRRSDQPPSGIVYCYIWEMLSNALNDMVSQGLVEEAKVDSFNLPIYFPSDQELKDVIEREGTFDINRLETFETNWDATDDDSEGYVFDNFQSARTVGMTIRAISESMIASHFGGAILDDLYRRFEVKVAEHLLKEKTKYVNLLVSLTKRG